MQYGGYEMRGIIAGAEYGGSSNKLTIYGGLDPEKLRQYILYWDKIDYPENNAIGFELTPDEKFLLDCGIMERTRCIFSGTVSLGADTLLDTQLAAFKNKQQHKKMVKFGQLLSLQKKLFCLKENVLKKIIFK